MRTKNLTFAEREKVVFTLGAYDEDTHDKFFYETMDLFLEEKGYSVREREKIKGINEFRKWFEKQFEKRDKYIIETMLIYSKDSLDRRFVDGFYNYPFYNSSQFRQYYQLLHQDFTHYDEMRMGFNFRQDIKLRINQYVGFRLDFKCPFTCEQHQFFYHLS